jgi:hypothetical protein
MLVANKSNATVEAEIRRITVSGQLKQNVCETLSQAIKSGHDGKCP